MKNVVKVDIYIYKRERVRKFTDSKDTKILVLEIIILLRRY